MSLNKCWGHRHQGVGFYVAHKAKQLLSMILQIKLTTVHMAFDATKIDFHLTIYSTWLNQLFGDKKNEYSCHRIE